MGTKAMRYVKKLTQIGWEQSGDKEKSGYNTGKVAG
jgi:hypothetical protein